MSPKLIYIISPHTSTPPPPILISIALPSFAPQILKRSIHLPFPGACGRSEKMKTSAPLQIPRNFSLRAGPVLLRTPGFPPHPLLPQEVDPLARLEWTTPVHFVSGGCFPVCVIHLAPILQAQEAFPANGALKVLKTSSSFHHIFMCVHVRKSVSVMKDLGSG